jgi:hypothetical protein
MKIFARMYEVIVRHECHVAWYETSKIVNSDYGQRGCDSSRNSQPKKNIDARWTLPSITPSPHALRS